MHTKSSMSVSLVSSRGRVSEVATGGEVDPSGRKSGRLGLAGLLSLGLLASCRTPANPRYLSYGLELPLSLPVEREVQGDVRESYRVQATEAGFEVVIGKQASVTVPKLGAHLADLTVDVAATRGVAPFSGVLLTHVVKDGAAVQAGLRGEVPGDVVMAMDGVPVVSVQQFTADLRAKKKVGDPVALQILRGQTKIEVSLNLGGAQEDVQLPPDRLAVAGLGPKDLCSDFSLVDLPEMLSERIYGRRERMLLVYQVASQSDAWKAGLRPYDRIVNMGGLGSGVPTLDQVGVQAKSLLAAGGDFELTVIPSLKAGTAKDNMPIDVRFRAGAWDKSNWELWVPFLHYQRSGPYSRYAAWGPDGALSYWSLGPLDMLASNRYSEVSSLDRTGVVRTNVFKALLGLIEVETGTEPTKVRLFWFLEF